MVMRNYDNNNYTIAVNSANLVHGYLQNEIHFGRQLIEAEDGSMNIPQSNID